MNEKIMFDGFNSDEINKYKEEVKDKYGKTDAYREYKNKTFNYKKGDWNNLNKEMLDIFKRISDKMDLDPGSNEVQELVEEWRNYISKNLYNCSKQIFKSLGEMYACNERFKNNIDKIKYGLAQFLSDAIKIYCN